MLESLFLGAATFDPAQIQAWAWLTLWVVLAFVAPFIVGHFLERALRMPGYGMKISYCLASITVSIFLIAKIPMRLGVDLDGGTVMIYSIDKEASRQVQDTGGTPFTMEALCQALTMRVNPDGLKEIVIRPYGEDQVEVIVPEDDPREVKRIQDILAQPGFLEFRIVANPREDGDLVRFATEQAKDPSSSKRLSNFVLSSEVDAQGRPKQIGVWAGLQRDVDINGKPGQYKWREGLDYVVRNANTGEILGQDFLLKIRPMMGEKGLELENYLIENKIEPQVLMRIDEEYAVKGSDLGPTDKALGLQGWEIRFTIKAGEPSTRMGQMTGRNLRGPGREPRYMAIILDNKVISAPAIRGRITDRGQITGNFTEQEVSFVVEVLRAGQLPAILEKKPSSENNISATLGKDTIDKGMYATGISLVAIVIFMLVYYRFAGIVANVALVMNLLLTVALMLLLKAPLTLPGLAGLVLTMGMAVDANVLIFERIREELEKGAALRMAIRNGFDRALVTIIDSNLTTLFTAVVLYLRGTDQVRGFATTLTLGLCTSMFTACYVARVIFDVFERHRWIKTLSMMKMFNITHVRFSQMMVPALCVSAVFMAIGAAALIGRGRGLFDIDFTGGTKAVWQLTAAVPSDQVRQRLDKAFEGVTDETGVQVSPTLTPINLKGVEKDRGYDLTCTLRDQDKLRKIVYDAMKDNFQTYSMVIEKTSTFTRTQPVESTPAGTNVPEIRPPAEVTPPTKEATPEKTPETTENTTPAPSDDTPKTEGEATEGATTTCQAPEENSADGKKDEEKNKEEPATTEPKPEPAEPKPEPKPEVDPAAPKPNAESPEAPSVPSDLKPPTSEQHVVSVETAAQLKFPSAKISADVIADFIGDASEKLFPGEPRPRVEALDVKDTSEKRNEWTVNISLDEAKARQILETMQKDMEGTPVFESVTSVGPQVAGKSKQNAVQAIILSLIMIMAYIWLRFHKLSWGIAAVAALVHDTLVMLGAVALSHWLFQPMGFLMVEDFRISLTVIAAFLTLIGFSINDTIVIFDRIREIRGKNPDLTAQMVDDSVNQTMSRTILTSGTVFLVLIVLYILGGPGVHAFSFALIVGVISGTYSTVFIAAPLLLWMLGKRGKGGVFGGA